MTANPGSIISQQLEAEKAKFWTERQYQHARSHFGSASRFKYIPKDDRYENAIKLADNWKPMNENEGTTNPRAQIGLELGKLISPGVGEYIIPSPNIVSTKTQKPSYSIGTPLNRDFYDFYVPPWRPKTPGPGPGGYMLPPAIQVCEKHHANSKPAILSEKFVRRNIRKPGPCQYPKAYKQHAQIRFNRPHTAFIAPLERPRPRTTMDIPNAAPIDRSNIDPEVNDTPGPGSYEVEIDPRVRVKAQTVVPRRPLLGQPEILVPGIRFYDVLNSDRFGRRPATTRGSPEYPSIQHLPNTHTAVPFSITREVNEKVWKTYKSEYAFRKEPTSPGKRKGSNISNRR